ncbi:hypothetical protein BG005_003744 [Podila minutissima]|nr:hypothetical protein BG005_003744 [Podila minutissima]
MAPINESQPNVAELTEVKVLSTPAASIRSIKPKRLSVLDNIAFCAVLCVIAGVATASQSAINSKMGQYSGKGLSSTLVFSTGAIASAIFWLIQVRGRPPANLTLMLSKAPWWSWFGGVLGATFVTIIILTIPKLGAGTTSGLIVCAKLIFSCIIDHFRLFGIPQRKYTLLRGVATCTLVASVAVIAKF